MKTFGRRLAAVVVGGCLVLLAGCAAPAGTVESGHVVRGTPLDRAIVLLQIEARSKQADIRANCIESLQPLADERALDVIGQGLHDGEWGVRFVSAMAAGHGAVLSLKPVLQQMAVTDANPNVQVAAIYALGRLGDNTHMSRLAETLADPDPGVRANTALVLGMLGNKSAIPLLKAHIREAELHPRFEITAALARLGDPAGMTALVAFSVSKYAEDRIFAMATWPDINSPDGADVLLSGLQDPMPGLQNPTPETELMSARIRLTAARSLGKLGNPIGRKGTAALTENPRAEIRSLAVLTLGDILGPNEDGVLLGHMDDPDQHVRVAAAAAIVSLHTRKAPGGEAAKP